MVYQGRGFGQRGGGRRVKSGDLKEAINSASYALHFSSEKGEPLFPQKTDRTLHALTNIGSISVTKYVQSMVQNSD